MLYLATKLAQAGTGLPCADAKARFAKGTKVELPGLYSGQIIYSGVVIGKGVDANGEYQEVRITSPADRKGIKRVRLMDLDMLREVK